MTRSRSYGMRADDSVSFLRDPAVVGDLRLRAGPESHSQSGKSVQSPMSVKASSRRASVWSCSALPEHIYGRFLSCGTTTTQLAVARLACVSSTSQTMEYTRPDALPSRSDLSQTRPK